jgi:hypothetical protein
MQTFTCSSCRRIVPANPRIKNQRYCGREACQRERKRKWQRAKMATDQDYRANQRDAQQAWRERNQGYWRRRRAAKRAAPSTPVKMDALTPNFNLIPGRYIITSIDRAGRKMDALQVKILPLSMGWSSRKKDSMAFSAAPL